jgi:hypothetical protein
MYFLQQLLYGTVLCFSSLLYGMENSAQQEQPKTVLKKITICDENNNVCVERTVWTAPDQTCFNYNTNGIGTNGISASEKDYQKITRAQQILGLTDYPCIVTYMRHPKFDAALSTFSSADSAETPTGWFLQMDPCYRKGSTEPVHATGAMRTFLGGHELGHCTTYGSTVSLQKNYNRYLNYATLGLSSTTASTLLLFTSLFFLPDSIVRYVKPIASIGAVGGFGTYLYALHHGSITANKMHAIELHCDTTSVNIGQTPEERIKIARGGLRYMNNPLSRATDYQNTKPSTRGSAIHTCKNYLQAHVPFPFTHPYARVRIQNLQTLIDENEKIIAQHNDYLRSF